MAIFTLAEIAAHKKALKDALLGVAAAQSYMIAGRNVQRMAPAEIRSTLDWLEQQERALRGSSGPAFFTAVPGRRG